MTDPMEEALAAERTVERLQELAAEDRPVPQMTPEQRRGVAAKYAGRPVEMVERFGIGLLQAMSQREQAQVMGWTLKKTWLAKQAAEIPVDAFEELLDAVLKEIPEHRLAGHAALLEVIDTWRTQSGRRPIRDRSAPTHRCPSCGHRW